MSNSNYTKADAIRHLCGRMKHFSDKPTPDTHRIYLLATTLKTILEEDWDRDYALVRTMGLEVEKQKYTCTIREI
jgi:hypothetical protein